MYSVPVADILREFNMELLNTDVDISNMVITHPEVNRPALQLAGFFDYFDSDRLQVIGIVEYSYLKNMSEEKRRQTFRKLFNYKLPCVVICRGLEPFDYMLKHASKKGIPILSYKNSTTEFMGEIIRWLKVQFAPRVSIHGVLVDVYGEGVLIMGESGIGKSESALELVKRGHRLVADDAVEIKKVSNETLVGSCASDVLKYLIELRGIGIIDIRQMFGVQSVKATQSVDLVIQLEIWDNKKEYDRLGLHEEHTEILGNKVVSHTIPIRPGRNLAIICESAAINHRQKKMGYNAAQVLSDRVMENIARSQSIIDNYDYK
jgi:HPr kinase/phosphorylase